MSSCNAAKPKLQQYDVTRSLECVAVLTVWPAVCSDLWGALITFENRRVLYRHCPRGISLGYSSDCNQCISLDTCTMHMQAVGAKYRSPADQHQSRSTHAVTSSPSYMHGAFRRDRFKPGLSQLQCGCLGVCNPAAVNDCITVLACCLCNASLSPTTTVTASAGVETPSPAVPIKPWRCNFRKQTTCTNTMQGPHTPCPATLANQRLGG
jgi:hypothetical protein